MLLFISRNRTALLFGLLSLMIGFFQWAIREQPLVVGLFRFDALSLFFGFALVFAAFCAALDGMRLPPRLLFLIVVALVALVVRSTLAIALLYGVIALAYLSQFRMPLRTNGMGIVLQIATQAPLLLASICLLVGYGLLALRGATFYDDPLAGAALDNWGFWFTLLGATLPLVSTNDRRLKDRKTGGQEDKKTGRQEDRKTTENCSNAPSLIRSFAVSLFLYPLVRLYSLGPWNSGWSLAAALFGGALALWSAWRFLVERDIRLVWNALLALALACFGLATSAGIAAGSFLVLAAAGSGSRRPTTDADLLEALLGSNAPTLQRSNVQSLYHTAFFAAPFVAVWMAVGAAMAGGVSALAGAAWAAGLVIALALTLQSQRHVSVARAGASCVLALGAPFVLLWLVEPVVGQLQGGLTPYGDVLIWPWIGVAFVNSAQAQVAVVPSIAAALLMVVLVSMVYLVARLRHEHTATPTPSDVTDWQWLWQTLREEVPWLGGRRRSDAE